MLRVAEQTLPVFFLFFLRIFCYPTETEDADTTYQQEYVNDPTFPEQNNGIDIPNLLEGDIIQKRFDTRQSVSNYQQTWTNNIVPYSFDGDYNSTEQRYIRSVLEGVMSLTSNCIQFVPRTSEKDYVSIQKQKGCYSEVGRIGGGQLMSLASHCYTYSSTWFSGTILHEVMHGLGFWHEHTRPNRDDFITVNFDNIVESHKYDYQKMSEEEVLQLETYDYYSIMHYSTRTFAIDKSRPTFEPKYRADISQIGQRSHLSEKDVSRIRKLYKCDKLIACSDPRPPRYGSVVKLSDTKLGSKLRYTCSDRYTLVGPSERFCRNDGKWSGDEPVCLSAYPSVNFCSFEVGTCLWNSVSGFGKWTRKSGTTETDKTGPVFDHTRETSEGYYMYIESSSPSKEGERFRMKMSGIPYTRYQSGVCMSFYTNTYGHGIIPGSLRVLAVPSNSPNGEKMIWKDDGASNKPEWIRRQIISPIFPYGSSRTMDIIIEAERGTSWTSDIAVDDIVMTTCDQIALYSKVIGSPTKISRQTVG